MSVVAGMGAGGMGFGGCMKPFEVINNVPQSGTWVDTPGAAVTSTDPFGDGSLIAKYLLNGDAKDLCGNYDGTETDVTYEAGKFGDCGNFNADTSKISLPSLAGSVTCSISFWWKSTNTDDTLTIAHFDDDADNNANKVCFDSADNTLAFYPYDTASGGGMYHTDSLTSYMDGEWHHGVISSTGDSNTTFYIDGIEFLPTFDGGTGTEGALHINNTTAVIGVKVDDTQNFDGSLDQVEIYNRALTPTEVKKLYTQTMPVFYPNRESLINSTDPFGDGSLVAKYLMDGDATDLCGNYDGTETGGLVYNTGKFGQACSFDGEDDYIATGLILHDADYTISLFMYMNDTLDINGRYSLFGYSESGSSAITLMIIDGSLEIHQNGEDIQSSMDANLLNKETWYHIVAGRKGSNTFLFVNGILINDNGTITDYSEVESYIGAKRDSDGSPDMFWDGLIDQVEIYNRALNPQEVQMLYTQSKYVSDPTLAFADNLVAHYPLDGTAEDIQGRGTNESGVEYNGVKFVDESKFAGSKVASFDGEDDYIDLGVLKSLTDLGICFWFKYGPHDPDTDESFFDFNYDTDSRIFVIADNDPTFRFQIGDTLLTTDTLYDDDMWHFCTMSRSGDAVNCYVDNVLIGTFTEAVEVTLEQNNFLGVKGSLAGYLNGQLADVRVYDRALTDDEITNLYNQDNEPTDGLVAYYPLDGDCDDYSQSHNSALDGTVNGDVSFANDSDYGDSVASFDGDGDNIVIDTSLVANKTALTISAWVLLNSLDTDMAILGAWDTSTTSMCLLYHDPADDEQWRFLVQDSDSNTVGIDNLFTSVVGEWMHICATYDSADGLAMYRDGKLKGTVTDSIASIRDADITVRIGADSDSSMRELNGKLANVQIFNRALTADEIKKLYNKETIISGLIAHYPLAEDATNHAGYYGTENGGLVYSEQYGDSVGSFDGSDDYIGTPTISLNDFTINAFVKLDGSTNSQVTSNNNSSQGLQEIVIRSDDKIRIDMDTDAYGLDWDISFDDFKYNWRMLTATRSGDKYNIYIDGKQLGDTQTDVTTTFDIKVICREGNFDGNLADVRIYDKALSAEQITDLYNKKDVTDGLVAHYPLTKEWRAQDRWVSYDGVENGVTYVESDLGCAVNFSTDDTNITLGTNTIVNNNSGTITAWVYGTFTNTDNNNIFIGNDGSGTRFQLLKRNNNDNYTLELWGTDIGNNILTELLKPNEWNYITLTRDGSVWTVGLNGVFETFISDTDIDNTPIILSRADANEGYNIKNVRIYNRALTASEIATIYNYEKVTRNIVVDRGLVAYYPLKNSSEDHWVNQYDGTDNGDVSYDGVSASFDGDGDNIGTEIGYFEEITFSFWANNVNDAITRFLSDKDYSTDNEILYFIKMNADNTIRVIFADGSNNEAIDSSTINLDSGFNLYTVCLHPASFDLYVNSVFIDTYTSSIVRDSSSTHKLQIGEDADEPYNLSNVRIYNRALTPEEVTTIYNAEKSQFE